MKRFLRSTAPAALLATLLIALLGGCGKERRTPDADPQPRTWDVPVATARLGAIDGFSVTGTVASEHRLDIASRLSGYVRRMPVQEGDRVQEGQLLAQLDAAEVESGIRQTEAALQAAKAAFDDARTDDEAFRELFSRGSVSDKEMRRVRLRLETAQAAYAQARAARDSAVAQRPYADIHSPIDGWVVAQHCRVGELVAPGVPLLTVESATGLVFETYVAQSRAAGLGAGAPVMLAIDGLVNPVRGAVSRVVPSADPVTRTQLVKIALPDLPALRPGLFGQATFDAGEGGATPVIPRAALVERGGLLGVFVLDSDGLVRFRWVRTGREGADGVEIDAGIAPGERFVSAAEPSLRDGDRIGAGNPAR